MSLTVQNMIDQTREIMDAVGSGEWSDTTLTTWLGAAHWQLYANLLNANRYYQMQQVTVTEDSNGMFNLTDLSTGTTDTKKYFYRILTVSQQGTPAGVSQMYYRKVEFEQFPNPQPNTSLPYVYMQYGQKIAVLPVQSGTQLQVTVNYRPPNPAQLSGTSVTVDFPEGYELMVPWRAAQLGLLKGGNETQAAYDIKSKADDMEHQFLQDLGRVSKWPIFASATDDPSMWAG